MYHTVHGEDRRRRLLRKICGPEHLKIRRESRASRFVLLAKCFWAIKSARMRLTEPVARMEGKRSACVVLVGEKRPLGKPRRELEDKKSLCNDIKHDGISYGKTLGDNIKS